MAEGRRCLLKAVIRQGLLFGLPWVVWSLYVSVGSALAQTQSGKWELLMANSGVSAMHMALTHNDKVIIFDRSDFGPSNISLPLGKCRKDPNDRVLQVDCWAHSIEYDIATNRVRPLTIQTDTWCSSGAMAPDGRLVQTGGFNDGERAVRMFSPCDQCDWVESPGALAERRWYASDQILPDGRIIVVGGRRQFSYEFVPKSRGEATYNLPFLIETADAVENNLYPFVHLIPDGNLFIFANTRAILLDYVNNRVVKRFPKMPGESRNYPSSGSSVLLPLDGATGFRDAEVLVCGGAAASSNSEANKGNFIPAARSCGRLRISDASPVWQMESMPMARVMGDMLLLPTGAVLIINGAGKGTAGWGVSRDPVLHPILYKPNAGQSQRFQVMSPSSIPRLYHSSCHVLPDGRVLVGGSNPNIYYNFSHVLYPTELSLEAFSPPYLSNQYSAYRPGITSLASGVMEYGSVFSLKFFLEKLIDADDISVSILAPSFTTHGFSMNQRLLRLRITEFVRLPIRYQVSVLSPPTAVLAPPGYYLLFVVHAGIPSPGKWVQIK
eukprot:Gb_33659 [translate_table: standard]